MSSTTTPIAPRRAPLLGLLCLLAGLSINPYFVGWSFAPDGQIQGLGKQLFIVAAGLIPALLGLGWLSGKLRLPSKALGSLLGLGALGLIGLLGLRSQQFLASGKIFTRQLAVLHSIDKSEDLIQWLTTEVRHLNKSAMNLRFPSGRGRALFAEQVDFAGIHSEGDAVALEGFVLAQEEHKSLQDELQGHANAELSIWPSFFEEVDYFDHAKFYIVRGSFGEGDPRRFDTDMGFAALAKLKTGHFAYVSGAMSVAWRNHTTRREQPVAEGESEDPLWLIESWQTRGLKLTHAKDLFFRDVLDSMIKDPTVLAEARKSEHEDKVLAFLTDEEWQPPAWFSMQAQDRHPGICALDINADGLDDIYLMARWGDNQLFINQGDGSFEESAESYGLAHFEHTSSAIFADFDNDGDLDAFLGRSLAPSVYLINDGGHFSDQSASLVGLQLPSMVSSVTAADYDNDGLLDVYFSTYASRMMHQEMSSNDNVDLPVAGGLAEGSTGKFLTDFLSEADSTELHRRFYFSGHPVHDRAGPPNRLLRNLGAGRFGAAKESPALEAWHHTYQAIWADFDQDGDQDIYLANDFAPNNLLRNDGAAGFTDVTEETNAADIGFGMGGGFGDYDNDGDEDLYVSNMFSKAGRRITAQIAKLDPVFGSMARGNSLMEFEDGKFTRVSGLDKSTLMVEKAGWSWAGQFIDFDNNGNLDVIALSGHYTAPKKVEIPVDT